MKTRRPVMRKLWQVVFAFAAAISTIFLLAAAGLWVRSFGVCDSLQWNKAAGDVTGCAWSRGKLSITTMHVIDPSIYITDENSLGAEPPKAGFEYRHENPTDLESPWA